MRIIVINIQIKNLVRLTHKIWIIYAENTWKEMWSVKLNQKPFKYSTFFPSDSRISYFLICASHGKIGDPSSYGVGLGPCPQMNLFWFAWQPKSSSSGDWIWENMISQSSCPTYHSSPKDATVIRREVFLE
jgi:hypothetical protein